MSKFLIVNSLWCGLFLSQQAMSLTTVEILVENASNHNVGIVAVYSPDATWDNLKTVAASLGPYSTMVRLALPDVSPTGYMTKFYIFNNPEIFDKYIRGKSSAAIQSFIAYPKGDDGQLIIYPFFPFRMNLKHGQGILITDIPNKTATNSLGITYTIKPRIFFLRHYY